MDELKNNSVVEDDSEGTVVVITDEDGNVVLNEEYPNSKKE